MFGVGVYSSLNDILIDHFSVDKTSWYSLQESTLAIKDFLEFMSKEGLIVNDAEYLDLGTQSENGLPMWLEEVNVEATITGKGERLLRDAERDFAEEALRNSIIDTNNTTKQILRKQTKIYWGTLIITLCSVAVASLTYFRDDSKKQLERKLEVLEKQKQQLQTQLSSSKSPLHLRIKAADSSTKK